MPIEKMMKEIGTLNGVRYWFAAEGEFEDPGIYFWNGTHNVRLDTEMSETNDDA